MTDSRLGGCPVCQASLSADRSVSYGRVTCPHCHASLWFSNASDVARFVVYGSSHPLAQLLEDPPPGMDSLDFIELAMQFEEEDE